MAALQPLSKKPWQGPQLQLPPQSATIPGTKFSTAACITERPTTASTTCSVPLCSINTIFGIDLFQVETHLSSVLQSERAQSSVLSLVSPPFPGPRAPVCSPPPEADI